MAETDVRARVFGERPYVVRVSVALAASIQRLRDAGLDDCWGVLDEIDCLEGRNVGSSTKPAEPFRGRTLAGFWHKHFFSPGRHMLPNLRNRWGLHGKRAGNKDVEALFQRVCRDGEITAEMTNRLNHALVMEGYEERSRAGRLTGDWIVYRPHDGRNYYLALGYHEEGDEALFQRLVDTCREEFPFLFPER